MSSRQSPHSIQFGNSRRTQILAAGFLTGAAAAIYPACGNILTDPNGFGFTSTQFGSLFVVQTVSAIVSALLSPRLRTSIRHSRLSQTGLFATGLAMIFLLAIQLLSATTSSPYFLVLVSSLLMGAGIGLGISVANVGATEAWSDAPQRGLTLLHTMLGLGLATSPLLVSAAISAGHWWIAPVVVGMGAVLLSCFVRSSYTPTANATFVESLPLSAAERHLVFMLGTFATLYGVTEASFSNWCVIYLHEASGVGLASAGLVLSGFWLAVMIGRLTFSVVTQQHGRLMTMLSPVLMTAAFLLIAVSKSVTIQVAGYLIAGLGCAAVYPALLGFSAQLPIRHSQFVSGLMVATVLAGTGLGTYVIAFLNRWAGLGLEQLYMAISLVPLVLIFGLWRIDTAVRTRGR